MDSLDLSVFKSLRDWLQEKQPVWLVTVIKTYGSSPRPPGAMLICRADGVVVGSVSGGCVEDDLIAKATAGQLSNDSAETLVYGATREEAERYGLPCGGSLHLLVEPVRDVSWVEKVLAAISQHQLVERQLDRQSLAVNIVAGNKQSDVIYLSDTICRFQYGPRWRLLIIGAAQSAIYLAEMAKMLDYQVLVCDPRPEIRAAWPLNDIPVLEMMPDDAVLDIQPDAHTAIVALTHDPKLDDMALLEALKSPAFYVGALGSARTNENRRERLAMFDLSADEIARLYGPVGLNIGSKTPPEIAVAILGQLIQLRRQSHASAEKATPGLACASQ